MTILPKDLFCSDEAPQADAAIVCGSSDAEELQQRTAAAVQLLLAGKTGLLLLCAGGRGGSQTESDEANQMLSLAEQAGARSQQIISVPGAGEISEIARECGKLLKQDVRLSSIRSLWLVSSAWHMLRVRIVMKHHLPRQLKLFCHPTSAGITAANWMKQPRGRALAENEIRLIDKLLKNGYSSK